MAKEIIIASVVEGTKEWSIKLGEKAKTMTFDHGRTIITEEEFEALKDQKKGFVSLLKSGEFSEPETNEVKHDAKLEKVEGKHKEVIKSLKESYEKDTAKALGISKSALGSQKGMFEKKLEKSNNALVASEAEVTKLKEQIVALKKGK